MNEEIMRIMKMLEEGKITAEQATSLVGALKPTESPSAKPAKEKNAIFSASIEEKRQFMESDMATDKIPGQKMLQVRVLSENGDKVKVNLPLGFVKGILKASGKIPMIQQEHMEGVNMQELMDSIILAIDNDLTGRIVDVESANGDLVIVEIVG